MNNTRPWQDDGLKLDADDQFRDAVRFVASIGLARFIIEYARSHWWAWRLACPVDDLLRD